MIKNHTLLKTLFLLFLFAGNDICIAAASSSSHKYQRERDPYIKHTIVDVLPGFSGETKRISTIDQHINYLKESISNAYREILITSHGVNSNVFKEHGLYPLLINARIRNVNIYIYNIDNKPIEDDLLDFFEEHGIKYSEAFTHAKILEVDKKTVAIGSYSWLAGQNDWDNATFCLTGGQCRYLSEFLWTDLVFYRHLQFGNTKQINAYIHNPENYKTTRWRLFEANMRYIHSLDAHREFIQDAFERASSRIIFCSPFIQHLSGYQGDFSKECLMRAFARNVHVYFICRKNDPNLSSFRKHLADLTKSPYLHLITLSDFHQKTVIVDDSLIAEGSFNWLSASRDELSEYHNHEVTLALEGIRAKAAIEDFNNSRVGSIYNEIVSWQDFI
jgi:phosphatidylserine/phosphatidylglycerophosphate/cardiolipin synthase-like enzyme